MCMYVCMYACLNVSMFVSMYVCIYVCMYVCVYRCMYVSFYISMSEFFIYKKTAQDQDLSGLSGFFRQLRSKSCFKMSVLNGFLTVYLKKTLKNRAGFELF